MAAISIKSFGGIAPRVSPRYLEDNQAQTALNCDVFTGPLRPMKNVGAQVTTINSLYTTMYKWGQDSVDDTANWLGWTGDVDVVRSQIAGDTSEWTFYTGDGYPKAIYAGALQAPIHLGLKAPTTACTATEGSQPAGSEGLTEESRVYTYTFVYKISGREIESAPAPASNVVNVVSGQSVTVNSFDTVAVGYAASHIRIYRAVEGTYLYVTEITIATTQFVDTVDPELLGEELPTIDWLDPNDNMKGLINMPNGIMAGFYGRDVYFCEPYVPHAWPASYYQTLDYPVVGLGRVDTSLVVLTKGTPYIIQGSHPDSMTVVKSDVEQACSSKRSIVSFADTVFYASPDGLVAMRPSGSQLLTERLFDKEQWTTLFDPTSIHGYQHELSYVGFYDNGTTQGCFIFDTRSGQFSTHAITATAGFHDLRQDKLFLNVAGSIKAFYAGSDMTYTWRSKLFDARRITSYSCCNVEAETYPVTAKFYAEGNLIYTHTVQSRDPFRLPPKLARDWEVEITGAYEVFSVNIAQSIEELARG